MCGRSDGFANEVAAHLLAGDNPRDAELPPQDEDLPDLLDHRRRVLLPGLTRRVVVLGELDVRHEGWPLRVPGDRPCAHDLAARGTKPMPDSAGLDVELEVVAFPHDAALEPGVGRVALGDFQIRVASGNEHRHDIVTAAVRAPPPALLQDQLLAERI